MKLKYDCRTIDSGNKCKYLDDPNNKKVFRIPNMYICKAFHSSIEPSVKDKGKITEELLGIHPIYNCLIISKLMKQRIIPSFEYSYSKEEKIYWNPLI